MVELGREIGVRDSWAAISGEYVIDSSGHISVPVAGRVRAAGRPLDEVERAVADSIHLHAGLAAPPSVSVEVVEHRPVYVMGYVHAPGEYSFRPGMTAIQAFALAGGERRIMDRLGIHQFQELFRNIALDRQVRRQLVRLQARATRLEAELAGKDEVEFPADGFSAGGPLDKSLMQEEQRLFKVRREARARARAAYQDLRSLLEAEINGLDEKLESHRRQIQLVRKTAGNIESLADRGLAPAQRLLDIQRMLADVEGKLIDLDTSKFRARQDLSKAARDLADRESGRAIEDERELQATRAEVEQLKEQQQMLRKLVVSTGIELEHMGIDDVPDLGFSVMRRREERIETIPADEGTLLQPGDVVSVRQFLSDPERAGGESAMVADPADRRR